MRQTGEVTEATLLDLARRVVSYRVRAAERSLTDAIETRGTAPGRIGFLRSELERARRAKVDLMTIPEAP